MAGHRPRNYCLTLQMQDFCKNYVENGGDAFAAAVAAGYEEYTAKKKSKYWLRDGRVAAEVQMYRERQAAKLRGEASGEGAPEEGSRKWAKQELIAIAKALENPTIKTADRINALALLARMENMAEEAKEEMKTKGKGLQITIVTRGGRGDG